jgi:DNA polymerase III delta subunit
MKSITIHGLDAPLDALIRKKAREQNLSLNKTIIKLLKESLGVSSGTVTARREVFADLCGVWTDEDIKEFTANSRVLRTLDPDDSRPATMTGTADRLI